ncbi:Luciferase-like, subgroup [Sphingobium chlorophenolicum L-1]|uniref:Luciferase-like, subgroup n=1 Tax=Sphingobium chlorophenolicum L-1 TaxID=690566 RepID=F6F284_SPHCR|nr:LLM class flavin-dependent oxidoreductase [Sphingobium chlorophenolicum]AEG50584.1 Luciferase-like, subgroup [Sphingobium chlorophenolicum L-1]
MIKVWNFAFNHVPGPAIPNYEDRELVQRAFNFNMNLIASMEKRGFEGVFFSEHHFVASLSPNPNLLVATLAARTERMKIGVMGNVLPFHTPFRLFEDLAMLDYLTNGRLEIGVASGIPPEFLLVKIPQDEIRPRFAETLDFLAEAEKDLFVTFNGQFTNIDDVPLMPRPRKEARRRHWMTIYSESSCRDAARRDFKVCTGFQSSAAAGAAFDAYRDEAAKHGRDVGPDDIGIRRQVVLGDTHEEAVQLNQELKDGAIERIEHTYKVVFDRFEKAGLTQVSSIRSSGIADASAVAHKADPKEKKGPAPRGIDVSDDEFISGSPATVAEQIVEQCRIMGAGNILAYQSTAMNETQLEKNYRLWEQVIPILAKADVLGGVPA